MNYRRYYISDRVIGIYFTSKRQLKEYYYNITKSYTHHYGNITEVKLKDINPKWKKCTL